jgi:hypothetical protein
VRFCFIENDVRYASRQSGCRMVRCRYGYSLAAGQSPHHNNTLAKYDMQTGETLIWHEPGCLPTGVVCASATRMHVCPSARDLQIGSDAGGPFVDRQLNVPKAGSAHHMQSR